MSSLFTDFLLSYLHAGVVILEDSSVSDSDSGSDRAMAGCSWSERSAECRAVTSDCRRGAGRRPSVDARPGRSNPSSRPFKFLFLFWFIIFSINWCLLEEERSSEKFSLGEKFSCSFSFFFFNRQQYSFFLPFSFILFIFFYIFHYYFLFISDYIIINILIIYFLIIYRFSGWVQIQWRRPLYFTFLLYYFLEIIISSSNQEYKIKFIY